MQDKIKLLNEGNQRLNDLYTDGIAENRNLQNKLDTCENRVMSLQSTLDQCQSDYQDAVISRKELELCRDELIDEQNAKEALNKNLEIMESENTELRNNLTSEKAENENLRNRIRQLEIEKIGIQSEFRKVPEVVNEIQGLATENKNLKNDLDTYVQSEKFMCKGSIVGKNGLSLLKTPAEIDICEDNGIYEKPKDSLLMFDGNARDGNDERAVMTRGLSSDVLSWSKKYIIGNKDKIITSFNTNGAVKYSFNCACGVIYQGIIHFFGGSNDVDWNNDYNYENQHFGFDEKRNFVKYKNLEIDFECIACNTFNIAQPNSHGKEVVLLCFDFHHLKNCYQFDDGELNHFADANEDHHGARLGTYKDQLITVGDWKNNQKTEILQSYNGQYKWTVGPEYDFSPTGVIFDYSMVNVPKIGLNEEYLLFIGGLYSYDERMTNPYVYSDKVHKYNGQWSFFGNLQKKRAFHGSVFLNGRVLIIGGVENWDEPWIKTETWDTSKSRFETESTWPELYDWNYLVFVVPDYINP